MNETEIAVLRDNIEKTIDSLITDKKLKYIADSPEFIEGLLIGLEVAGIYGDEIKNMYTDHTNSNESD